MRLTLSIPACLPAAVSVIVLKPTATQLAILLWKRTAVMHYFYHPSCTAFTMTARTAASLQKGGHQPLTQPTSFRGSPPSQVVQSGPVILAGPFSLGTILSACEGTHSHLQRGHSHNSACAWPSLRLSCLHVCRMSENSIVIAFLVTAFGSRQTS